MKKLACCCLMILASCFSKGQHAVVISGHPITYNQHEGWLKNKSGEYLKGSFQYAEWEFPSFNLKVFDSTKKMIVKRIPTRYISQITLAGHDSVLSNLDSTYFKRIDGEKRLFRQLSFGDTKIFDDLFSVDENPGRLGNDFVIIQDSTIIFVSEKENLGKTVSKLPKPIPVPEGEPALRIIQMLNNISTKKISGQ